MRRTEPYGLRVLYKDACEAFVVQNAERAPGILRVGVILVGETLPTQMHHDRICVGTVTGQLDEEGILIECILGVVEERHHRPGWPDDVCMGWRLAPRPFVVERFRVG